MTAKFRLWFQINTTSRRLKMHNASVRKNQNVRKPERLMQENKQGPLTRPWGSFQPYVLLFCGSLNLNHYITWSSMYQKFFPTIFFLFKTACIVMLKKLKSKYNLLTWSLKGANLVPFYLKFNIYQNFSGSFLLMWIAWLIKQWFAPFKHTIIHVLALFLLYPQKSDPH